MQHCCPPPSLQRLPEGAAPIVEGVPFCLLEDASPGMTADLLESLQRGIWECPHLAVALLQHSLFQVAATTANLAEAASQGAAAGMAADAAAAAPDGHGVTAGQAAGSDGSQGTAAGTADGQDMAAGTAADTAADDQGVAAHAAADATARQRYDNLKHDCQVVIGALDGSLRQSLQAALQRHGVPPGSSGDGSGSSGDGSGSSSDGSSSGSSAMLSGGGSAGCSQKEELRAALAAAKSAADSERLLEEGGEFGDDVRAVNSEVLTQAGEHLQRVWQLEQPAEEQTAARLRLAAAAALRSCANLSCTDLSGASEADCRGKKCRWAREGRLRQIAAEAGHAEMRDAVLLQ